MSLTSPSQFENLFDSLYLMFNMSLEEMAKSYPLYKLGRDKLTYLKDRQQFNSIRAEIFEQQHILFSAAEKVEQQINKLNTQITANNKKNNNLNDRVNNFGSVGLAAKGELKIQKVLYNELYAGNIILVILILLYIGIFFKTRKMNSPNLSK